jgi:hypothetical protein
MAETTTRIRPGSPLRAPGASSWDWGGPRFEPVYAGALATGVYLLITAAVAVAAWVVP